MRSAALRGREHPYLGAVSAIAEGCAAIAISRGGAAKTYPHKDPNEDAVGFATTRWGALVAVADGHAGCEGAEAVLERLIARHAPRWLEGASPGLAERWVDEAPEVLLDLNGAIVELIARGATDGARTTLSVGVARPGDDLLAWLSVGDSHVFAVGAKGAREIGAARQRVAFLGSPAEDRASLAERSRAGTETLHEVDALVLSTDGLSERGIGVDDPASAVARVWQEARQESRERRAPTPLVAARGLAACALESHERRRSGDNIATAVAWLDGRARGATPES
jgi:serine/threonine protein phosphatase PrpC